ncbi:MULTISPECIES: hypothetical protein [Anaerostipes]|uniref:Bypass of forespore C C-terminal domain-containing protein n=1 Tax=Anaerostipes butyraticus TaxID=645466 RepID=A0A916Q6D3_9FIRM|nr:MULTISPECIES: hypothetical protein [Anaerostipes]GFO83715.1 hypothetical protein ANBU17_00620 [Anaerostipes butyraticus]
MMNKVNRFLLIYIVVITALCGYMCYTAFEKQEKGKVIHQVQSTAAQKEKEASTTAQVKTTYGLAIKEGSLVVVNNHTKEVFEYTDMKKEDLPSDILQMIQDHKVFESREEVYHFLESYSS